MLTLDLTGDNALSANGTTVVTIAVKDPGGADRDLTGHTCVAIGRPSWAHLDTWFSLSETDGIALSTGQIQISIPAVSTSCSRNGLAGVWTLVLKDASGALVCQVNGQVEVPPSAVEPD